MVILTPYRQDTACCLDRIQTVVSKEVLRARKEGVGMRIARTRGDRGFEVGRDG